MLDAVARRFRYPEWYQEPKDFNSGDRVRLFMDDHVIFFRSVEEASVLMPPIT